MAHYNSYPFTHLMSDQALVYLAGHTLLAELVPLPVKINRILDVGCGAAAVMERFNQHYWQRQITAIDSSRVSLLAAKTLAPADYQLASAAKLPFPDKTYDLILSCGVIHHIREYHLVFKEISRVLRPKGLVYLTLYNSNHPYRYFYYLFIFRFFYPGFWLNLFSPIYFILYNLFSLLVLKYFASFREARSDLADRFFNPYVHFFSDPELNQIYKLNHLKIVNQSRHALGTMNSYLLTKYV